MIITVTLIMTYMKNHYRENMGRVMWGFCLSVHAPARLSAYPSVHLPAYPLIRSPGSLSLGLGETKDAHNKLKKISANTD